MERRCIDVRNVAVSHSKLRLWNCLSYSQNSETAGGNVPLQAPPLMQLKYS